MGKPSSVSGSAPTGMISKNIGSTTTRPTRILTFSAPSFSSTDVDARYSYRRSSPAPGYSGTTPITSVSSPSVCSCLLRSRRIFSASAGDDGRSPTTRHAAGCPGTAPGHIDPMMSRTAVWSRCVIEIVCPVLNQAVATNRDISGSETRRRFSTSILSASARSSFCFTSSP